MNNRPPMGTNFDLDRERERNKRRVGLTNIIMDIELQDLQTMPMDYVERLIEFSAVEEGTGIMYNVNLRNLMRQYLPSRNHSTWRSAINELGKEFGSSEDQEKFSALLLRLDSTNTNLENDNPSKSEKPRTSSKTVSGSVQESIKKYMRTTPSTLGKRKHREEEEKKEESEPEFGTVQTNLENRQPRPTQVLILEQRPVQFPSSNSDSDINPEHEDVRMRNLRRRERFVIPDIQMENFKGNARNYIIYLWSKLFSPNSENQLAWVKHTKGKSVGKRSIYRPNDLMLDLPKLDGLDEIVQLRRENAREIFIRRKPAQELNVSTISEFVITLNYIMGYRCFNSAMVLGIYHSIRNENSLFESMRKLEEGSFTPMDFNLLLFNPVSQRFILFSQLWMLDRYGRPRYQGYIPTLNELKAHRQIQSRTLDNGMLYVIVCVQMDPFQREVMIVESPNNEPKRKPSIISYFLMKFTRTGNTYVSVETLHPYKHQTLTYEGIISDYRVRFPHYTYQFTFFLVEEAATINYLEALQVRTFLHIAKMIQILDMAAGKPQSFFDTLSPLLQEIGRLVTPSSLKSPIRPKFGQDVIPSSLKTIESKIDFICSRQFQEFQAPTRYDRASSTKRKEKQSESEEEKKKSEKSSVADSGSVPISAFDICSEATKKMGFKKPQPRKPEPKKDQPQKLETKKPLPKKQEPKCPNPKKPAKKPSGKETPFKGYQGETKLKTPTRSNQGSQSTISKVPEKEAISEKNQAHLQKLINNQSYLKEHWEKIKILLIDSIENGDHQIKQLESVVNLFMHQYRIISQQLWQLQELGLGYDSGLINQEFYRSLDEDDRGLVYFEDIFKNNSGRPPSQICKIILENIKEILPMRFFQTSTLLSIKESSSTFHHLSRDEIIESLQNQANEGTSQKVEQPSVSGSIQTATFDNSIKSGENKVAVEEEKPLNSIPIIPPGSVSENLNASMGLDEILPPTQKPASLNSSKESSSGVANISNPLTTQRDAAQIERQPSPILTDSQSQPHFQITTVQIGDHQHRIDPFLFTQNENEKSVIQTFFERVQKDLKFQSQGYRLIVQPLMPETGYNPSEEATTATFASIGSPVKPAENSGRPDCLQKPEENNNGGQ